MSSDCRQTCCGCLPPLGFPPPPSACRDHELPVRGAGGSRGRPLPPHSAPVAEPCDLGAGGWGRTLQTTKGFTIVCLRACDLQARAQVLQGGREQPCPSCLQKPCSCCPGGAGALHPPQSTAAPGVLQEGSGSHHCPPWHRLLAHTGPADPTTAKNRSASTGQLPASPESVRSTQQKSAWPMQSFPLF